MQYSEEPTFGRQAAGRAHEGIVALGLVLPRPQGGARAAHALLALCPFVGLGRGSRPGEPGAVPAGHGPLAMPWSEPRWWGWPPEAPAVEGPVQAPGLANSQGRARDGELPIPARRAPAESLRVLLTLLPAVRWIERASQRPGPRGAASRSPFRWTLQPPLGLLPGLSRVAPAQGEARMLPTALDRDLPWRPAGTAAPGLPAQAAAPAAPAARLPAPRDRGAPSPAMDHTAAPANSGTPAAGELPTRAGGALPGLAALDAVRAVPYAALRDRGTMPPARSSAAPGTGATPARLDALRPPFAAETSPRSPGQPRRDGGPGLEWVPAGSYGPGGVGVAEPLPWPDPRPATPGEGPPPQGVRPVSPAESEPGPYAPAAVRGLAAMANAFQAAERLVERRVRVEVARATRKVQAEVDEQLRAQDRRAAAELVSDEALQGLMQRLRALVREERFREGRLR